MMKIAKLGAFFFFLSFFAATASWAQKAEIKKQTEAGFNLEQSAALAILQKYSFEGEDRVDYYADIYDGTQFLLIPHPDMYKFRLKATDKKAVLQANTKISITPFACSEGMTFKVKEKAVGELKLNKDQAQDFAKKVTAQLDSLATTDVQKSAQGLRAFHKELVALPVPLLDKLLKVPTTPSWYFVASHLTRKVKWTLDYSSAHGPMEISITEGSDYVGSTFIQKKYEIEFQIEDSMTAENFAGGICQFMNEQRLSLEDLSPTRDKPQAETLRRLQKLNSLLGL